MTTNTTNSEAASIDTPEFDDLLLTYWECRNHGESYAANERAELIAYIDGRLAQSRVDAMNEGLTAGRNEYRDAYLYQKSRADEAEEWLNTEKEFSHAQEQRAAAAESRLAEIQRGVEGLKNPYLNRLESDMGCGFARCRDDVIALLQPQGQADTSGLPE